MNRIQVLTALTLMAVCLLLGRSASCTEGKGEHKRYLKEYALFVQDKLEHETEIRTKMSEYISANKELYEGEEIDATNPKALERYKFVYGDFSWDESENAALYYFIENELNDDERKADRNISRLLSYWTNVLYFEEAVKLKIGEEEFNRLKKEGEKSENFDYDRITSNMRQVIQPYINEELSPEDLKGISFHDLWPKCKLSEDQIRMYFKTLKK